MANSLNGLDLFASVVEAGSFAQAAERLHLTRSAVGKGIARLEQRLGVQLFHRTTRSQSLTEEGALFHRHCLRALEEVRLGEAALASNKLTLNGSLKVSMPVLFGQLCVAPLLLELARPHLERGELREVLGSLKGRRYPINALWPHSPHLPLKTRMAIDWLASRLPERLACVAGAGSHDQ